MAGRPEVEISGSLVWGNSKRDIIKNGGDYDKKNVCDFSFNVVGRAYGRIGVCRFPHQDWRTFFRFGTGIISG
jgi:hypothetical protein